MINMISKIPCTSSFTVALPVHQPERGHGYACTHWQEDGGDSEAASDESS
jgi:hypothetical protein